MKLSSETLILEIQSVVLEEIDLTLRKATFADLGILIREHISKFVYRVTFYLEKIVRRDPATRSEIHRFRDKRVGNFKKNQTQKQILAFLANKVAVESNERQYFTFENCSQVKTLSW